MEMENTLKNQDFLCLFGHSFCTLDDHGRVLSMCMISVIMLYASWAMEPLAVFWPTDFINSAKGLLA